MMIKRAWWALTGAINRWRFNRAFNKAPVRLLGNDTWVKEVWGNLYVVDMPLSGDTCDCFQCVNRGK